MSAVPATAEAQAALEKLMAMAKGQPPAKPLSKLREDLVISQGPAAPDGAPSWLIYDPLRHRFIDIDQTTFKVLALWPAAATAEALIQAVRLKVDPGFDDREAGRLAAFLDAHGLTTGGPGDTWQALAKAAAARPHGLVMTLVHNYLFFKIPLWSPQRFLDATQSSVDWLFTRWAQRLIILIGLAGVYLAAKQWDEFIGEARGLASLGGIASFGATLFVVKAFHEMGHAYAAVRHGCRVPSMGLAFMMMAPLLYTDVTDAWRLTDKRKRLAIDSAGVAVELGLACLATFVWVFLPDGLIRHIAWLIATTSWTMSVAINLNPFMRFDGYYIVSDLLGVPNLQARAFALGQWQLREILFGLRAPCPEVLPGRLTACLIAYAWSVWVYRFFLFIGIAALVYTYFFKLLGIALFAFEIGYFVIKPIVGEMTRWWKLRMSILTSPRTYVTLGLCACGLAAALIPWSTRVTVPAMLEARELARVFPPRSARVKQVVVVQGQHVERGEVLAVLEQPDLDFELATVRAKAAAVQLRLDRQSADRDDRDDVLVLSSEKEALKSRLQGLALEMAELSVRASTGGVIAELNPALTPGRWVAVKEQIALIAGTSGAKIRGYLPEDGLWRVDRGSAGRFIPDVPLGPSAEVVVSAIAAGSSAAIEIPELATPSGGRIEVQSDQRQRLVPTTAHYLVEMSVPEGSAPMPTAATRGTVHLTGRAESLFATLYRRTLKILVRESGA
jgi:putative peptide zinc metalloprotease protein